MPDDNLYRFVEVSVIANLTAEINLLKERLDNVAEKSAVADVDFALNAVAARVDEVEKRINEYDKKRNDAHGYAYKTSLVVVSPDVMKQQAEDGTVIADEVFFVASTAEAQAKAAQLTERPNWEKRKILVAQQSSLRPVPF